METYIYTSENFNANMTVLFLSYNHGNNRLADSIQNTRLIYELSKGVNVDIVYRSRHKKRRIDNYIPVSSLDLSFIDRIIYKIFPFLKTIISLDVLLWSICACYSIKKGRKHYDVCMATYEPYSTRFLPLFLRRIKQNDRIISIFYDPCTENLFFNNSNVAVFLRRKMERDLIVNSDYVVVNNNRLFEKLKQRNGDKNNIVKIPLCSSSLFNKSDNCGNTSVKRIIITHAGNIHGNRSLLEINKVISDLKQKVANLSDKLRIDFYGDCPENKKKVVVESGNEDVLCFYGTISQAEINMKLEKSNILLLLDPMEGNNFSFPSKLCEYFNMKKPIIGLTSQNSVSYDLLCDSKHLVYNSLNYMDLSKDLKLIIDGFFFYDYNREYYRSFEPSIVSQMYIKLIMNQ